MTDVRWWGVTWDDGGASGAAGNARDNRSEDTVDKEGRQVSWRIRED